MAASYLRIAGSGGNANLDPAIVGGVAPTHDPVTGWTLNGSTQYLITGVIPASTWTMLVRFSNGPTGNTNTVLGCDRTATGAWHALLPRRTGGTRGYYNNSLQNGGVTATSGVIGMANRQGYFNGVADHGTLLNGYAGDGIGLYIGALNRDGAPLAGTFWPGNVLVVVIYDTSTGAATWLPAVSAAMAAL